MRRAPLLALAASLACGEGGPLVLSGASPGDVLVVVAEGASSTRVETQLITGASWTVDVDSEAEVYGFLVPKGALSGPLGRPLSDPFLLGVRGRLDGDPAPEGSCGRCFVDASEAPMPIWPGSACAIPASARAFTDNDATALGTVRGRVRLDWPGRCDEALPPHAPVAADAFALEIYPRESLWPGTRLVATASGAAFVGEHSVAYSDGAVVRRLGLLPDELIAASDGPDGLLALVPGPRSTRLVSLDRAGVATERGSWPDEIESIVYDPGSGLVLVGGFVQGFTRNPVLRACTLDPLRCGELAPSGLEDASFRTLSVGEDGRVLAKTIGGKYLLLEPLPRGALPEAVLEDAPGSHGRVRFAGGATVRWAFLDDTPGAGAARARALSDALIECADGPGGAAEIRSRPLGPEIFDGARGPATRLAALGPGAQCLAIAVETATSAQVFLVGPRAYACGASGCTARVESGPSARFSQVVAEHGRLWATSDTGLYRRERGAWSRVAGTDPGSPAAAILPTLDGFWAVEGDTVHVLDPTGEERERFTTGSWRSASAGALGESVAVVLAEVEDASCALGKSKLFTVGLSTRAVRELPVELGCGPGRDVAWLGEDRYLLIDGQGAPRLVEGEIAREVRVDGDDPDTLAAEAADPRGLLALSARGELVFAGGHDGELYRLEGWREPPRLRRIFIDSPPEREPIFAVYAAAPDVGFAGLRNPRLNELGELWRTEATGPGHLDAVSEPRNELAHSGLLGHQTGSPAALLGLRGELAFVFSSSFHLVGSDWRLRLGGMQVVHAASDGTTLVLGGSHGQWAVARPR